MLSWDRLHAYHGGLFSDHLWAEFKLVIDELSRQDATKVDEQCVCIPDHAELVLTELSRFDLVPRWPGLNHFSSVIKTGEFADGSKYEDMSKVMFT